MDNEQTHNLEKWKTRAFAGVAVLALCAIVWIVLYIFGILWQAVATVIVTAIIAFMLHGPVNYLESRGLSRLASTAISMVVFLAIIIGCFALFVPALVEQISAFSTAAPTYAQDVLAFIESNIQLIPVDSALLANILDQITHWTQEQAGVILQAAAGGIVEGVAGVGNGVLIFSIALVCAFWVLVDLPTISRELMSLFNDQQQKSVRVVTDAFNIAVYGWMKATLTCAVVTGVVNGVAYWLMNIPYFALLGFLCGILYVIPYIGPIIGAVVVFLVALLVSPAVAIGALIVNTVANNLVASILSPRLMRSSVSVHPALSLIVILIGGALGGIVGMLFSIPIAAAAQGVFITFFEKYTGKELATENGALFRKQKVKFTPTWRRRKPKGKTKSD